MYSVLGAYRLRSMRILMIGWEYPPNIVGGLGIACEGLARALALRGHKVLFLLPRLHGNEASYPGIELIDVTYYKSVLPKNQWGRVESLLAQLEDFDKWPQLQAYSSGASIQEDPLADKQAGAALLDTDLELNTLSRLHGGYTSRIMAEVEIFARVASIFAPYLDFDIIHAHDWMSLECGRSISFITGKQLVCHIHATEFDRTGDSEDSDVAQLERHHLRDCEQIIAVSQYTKSILSTHYGLAADKISVVYNGISPFSKAAVLENQTKALDKIVLFLGRITFQKGPEYFVQAAAKVIDKIPDVHFVMAGSGDMYHRMIEFTADMGIGEHFHFTGKLNRADVSRIYQQSDLFVLPSVSEPFGLTPLEAASYGVPVIISRQSGVGEVFKSCLRANFWDVEELAEKMISVLTDSVLAESLRKNAKLSLGELTWEKAAAEVEKIYKRTN